jgi:hypothetical protein
MRHYQAVVLALLLLSLGGCLTAERAGSPIAARPLAGMTGDDVVVLHLALIERPAEDPYLADKVWEPADEQCVRVEREVSLEQKALLADNGFRIGQLSGTPPGELHRLVNSARSCVNPRQQTLHADQPLQALLGPVLPGIEFGLRKRGEPVAVTFDQARCQFEIVPTLTEEGKVLLHFTPRIEHGEKTMAMHPAVDPASGSRYWRMEVEKDAASYPWLGWDMLVGPSECVLIGAGPGGEDTLGAACFTASDGPTPVRRLLVLRVGRPLPELGSDEMGEAAPLALQAARPTTRGEP